MSAKARSAEGPELASAVEQLQRAAVSAAHVVKVRADWDFFVEWCRAHQRDWRPPLPETVSLFLFSQREHWGWATTRGVRSSLGDVCRADFGADPTAGDRISHLLTAIGRDKGRRSAPRSDPILPVDAIRVSRQAPTREGHFGRVLECRDRLALVLRVTTRSPLRQLAALTFDSVQRQDGSLVVHLPPVPTHGNQPAVRARLLVLPATGGGHCPVAAFEEYVDEVALLERGPLLLGAHLPYRATDVSWHARPEAVVADLAAALERAAHLADLAPAYMAADTETVDGGGTAPTRILTHGLDESELAALTATCALVSVELLRPMKPLCSSAVAELRRRTSVWSTTPQWAVVADPVNNPELVRALTLAGAEVVGLASAMERLIPKVVDDFGAVICPEDLNSLLAYCNWNRVEQLRDGAYALVGIALMRRHAELYRLNNCDVKRVPDGYLVTVPPSKGLLGSSAASSVAERTIMLDETGGPACPVAALDAWRSVTRQFGWTADGLALLPRILDGRPCGRLPASSNPMTARLRQLFGELHCATNRGPLPPRASQVGTRGLRVGGIVASAAGGADVWEISMTSLHECMEQLGVYLRSLDPFADGHHLDV